jgi:hypothetical protein
MAQANWVSQTYSVNMSFCQTLRRPFLASTRLLYIAHSLALIETCFVSKKYNTGRLGVAKISSKSRSVNKAFILLTIILKWKILLAQYTFFQVLVLWVTIWLTLIVSSHLISLVNHLPQRSSGNVPEISEYHGTLWQMLDKKNILFVALQNEFGWRRDCVNNLCLNINWLCWLSP